MIPVLLTLLGLLAVVLLVPFTRRAFFHLAGHALQHAIDHLHGHYPRTVEAAAIGLAWVLFLGVVAGAVLAVYLAVSFILFLFA